MFFQGQEGLAADKIALSKLKIKIKKWEVEYFENYGQKPKKIDIDRASDLIKDLYSQYWKLKRSIDKSVNEPAELIEHSSWGLELNKSFAKSRNEESEQIGSLFKFSEKLKSQALKSGTMVKVFRPINPTVKKLQNDSEVEVSSDLYNKGKSEINSDPEHENKNVFVDQSIEVDAGENFESNSLCGKKFKVIRSSKKLKNGIKSINTLSPFNTFLPNGQIALKPKINLEWIERCTSFTTQKEVPDVEFENDTCEGAANSPEYVQDTQRLCKTKKIQDKCITSVTGVWSNSDVQKNNFSDGLTLFNSKGCRTKEYADIKEYTANKSEVKDVLQQKLCSTSELLQSRDFANKKEDFVPKANCSFTLHPEKRDLTDDVQIKRKKIKLNKISGIEGKTSEGLSSFDLHQASFSSSKKSSNSLNENYVCINIKKKRFSRGHHRINIRNLKWKKWKQMKKGSGNSSKAAPSRVGSSSCFKCGKEGHWAQNCEILSDSNDLLPRCDDDFVESPLPTIEEAAEMAKSLQVSSMKHPDVTVKDASLPSVLPNDQENNEIVSIPKDPEIDVAALNTKVSALFDLSSNKRIIETPCEVKNALKMFGYSQFRTGQEKAIMRILSGLSTLVVLPTGSGKSLCYQLPAYLYAQRYSCISLIVSPLVSLMEDQVTGLPSFLQAVCIHSGMSDSKKDSVLDIVIRGKAQILLVSPEAVISGKLFKNKFWSINFPPIAFACIDEAHCLSEWSHNFRPSYLQLFKVLTKKLGIRCILGLTATATRTAALDIAHHLGIQELSESVIGRTNVPSNLQITVSRDKDKDWALIELLKEERFQECYSILIYCIRRSETERVATLIRTSLQMEFCTNKLNTLKYMAANKVIKNQGKHLAWSAEAYHAGLSVSKRRSVQKKFMTGKLRVVVATVAFGMGLDKSDVRAVIHFNMPKSFESYVQEIGRAGRDGLSALCHMFLDCEKSDVWELRRHIYSNSIDRRIIRKLLQKIFSPCKCIMNSAKIGETIESLTENEIDLGNKAKVCSKHEKAFSIEKAVQELDAKEENISTLLCYLAHHPKQWIEILSPTYSTCIIRCYGGCQQMKRLIKNCPLVAAAMALDKQLGKNWDDSNQYQFQVIDLCSHMLWDSYSVKKNLKQLEWGGNKKTGILVEFSVLSFHLLARGDLDNDELDAVLDFLYEKVKTREENELKRLNYMFSTFMRFSFSNHWSCTGEVSIQRSNAIKEKINEYFEGDHPEIDTCILQDFTTTEVNQVALEHVRQCIRDFILTHRDHNFTGRAIARILHGISSPSYPAEVWGRVHKFWRSHLNNDFNTIIKVANDEILNLK